MTNLRLFMTLIATLGFTFSAQAVETGKLPQIDLLCQLPIATARIHSDDQKLHFTYYDQYGFNNFPIYEGVVTAPSIPLIDRAVKELRAFDGELVVSWNRSQCKFDASKPLLLECTGRMEFVKPNGMKQTTASGISTTLESNERLDMNYQRLKINLGVDSEMNGYMHHFITFPFAVQTCRATYQ